MSNKKYTVLEISRQLGVNSRQVQRMLKDLINIEKGSYVVDYKIVKLLQSRDNLATNDDIIVEGFTPKEYEEFRKRLIEYPLLKNHIKTILNELEYHRRSSDSKDRQLEIILQNIQQRNFIEAKEKKIE